MALNWLYGTTIPGPSQYQLRSYTLDIDIVKDTYRLLTDAWELDLVRREEAAAAAADGDMEPSHRLTEVRGQKPRIWLNRYSMPMVGASSLGEIIAVEDVADLGAHERAQLMVWGGGVDVSFCRGIPPMIRSTTIQPTDIVDRVANLIMKAGRPRPRWAYLSRLVPLVLTALLTVAVAWLLLSEPAPVPLVVVAVVGLVLAWLLAAIAYRWMRERYTEKWPGHRFREVSRADFRARMANNRANVLVAAITAPVAAIIGFWFRLWLGG